MHYAAIMQAVERGDRHFEGKTGSPGEIINRLGPTVTQVSDWCPGGVLISQRSSS